MPRLLRMLAALGLAPLLAAAPSLQAPLGAPAGGIRPVLAAGDYDADIASGGVERHAILHVPEGYDGRKPLPLVFVLHGFGGSAASMIPLTEMSEKADDEGFFVAYLDGTPCVPQAGSPCVGQRGWNNGLSAELGITVDDVGFVRDALKHLQALVRVDVRRVYAAGFSNGGMMCHRLGSELSDLLAGVAVVEGTIGIRQDDGEFLTIPDAVGSIPIVIVHGRNDEAILYEGGQGGGTGQIYAKSVADAVAFWTEQNHCRGRVTTEVSADGNVVRDSYGGCFASSDVVLYSIGDGTHSWPRPHPPLNTGFWATDAVWDFFASHPRTAP